MSQHRFKVGSIVSMQVDRGSAPQPGRYLVEAQMPPVGTLPQYRIKSEAEGFRRVVVEHQLSAFGTTQPPAAPNRAEVAFRGEED